MGPVAVIFQRELEPLTPRQRNAYWILTAVTAITRWFAMSRSLWDWDENLFILALRHYDVASHHPHPPGFPLFIATAKVFQAIGFSSFHALQAVNLVAAVLLFPAMFALAREFRASFATSILSALFLAYFPNVWFFGGTGFSDVPSITIVVAAAALLLRGCRSNPAFYWGALLAAISIGYRPQNLAIVAVPFLIASFVNLRRAVAGALIIVAIAGGSYAAAAYFSGGWQRYHSAVAAHQHYIVTVDSFRAPRRPPLRNLVDDFFMRPYRAPVINILITLLVLTSCVAALVWPNVAAWMAIACFAPLSLMSFLFLDWMSVSRFSIGYAPMMALLAADGLRVAARRWQLHAGAAILAIIVIWMFPALREAHTLDSPPVAAAQWLRAHDPSTRTTLYVDEGLNPHAEVLLGDYERHEIDVDAMPPEMFDDARGVVYSEIPLNVRDAHIDVRPRPRLWYVVRRRYFIASVAPAREVITFSGDWNHGTIGRRVVVHTPPIDPAKFTIELEPAGQVADVTLTFNGRPLDHFKLDQRMKRKYYVLSRSRAPNEIAIETSSTAHVVSIGWSDKD